MEVGKNKELSKLCHNNILSTWVLEEKDQKKKRKEKRERGKIVGFKYNFKN